MSKMMLILSLLSLIVLVTGQGAGLALRQCPVSDRPALNKCLRESLQGLRNHARDGIPELGLPALEPMFLGGFNFEHGEGLVIVKAKFSEVLVHGASGYNILAVDADPVKRILQVRLQIPQLRIEGSYILSGNIIVLNINGNGPFTTNLTGIDAGGVSNIIVKKDANGVEKLNVVNTNIHFAISDVSIKMDNLFNGDAVLGETVNLFLNQNSQEILKEIEPEVKRRLNELIRSVMNNALSQLPVETFLL